MIELHFIYSESLRERIRDGKQWREWALRYAQIFDADDIRIQKNQPSGHFVESVAAVLLYESTGYLSLVEKYGSPAHPGKVMPFCTRVPETVRAYLDALEGGHPDLFTYDP